MDQDKQYQIINEKIDLLEKEINSFVEKQGEWTRKCETIMDRLVMIGAKVHDSTHGCKCEPDPFCTKYKRSMLKRVRRALRYEQ